MQYILLPYVLQSCFIHAQTLLAAEQRFAAMLLAALSYVPRHVLQQAASWTPRSHLNVTRQT